MKNDRHYEIISTNKIERTITIKCTYENGDIVKYKSTPLAKEEWQYYANYATENDIKNFLKSDDYYILK